MRKFLITAIAVYLALSLNAYSQSVNATLGGTVQDDSGAFIPGVSITATNDATGIVTTLITNEAGAYQFASLQPGTYSIKADLPGFQAAIAKGFALGGAQQARLNFTLKVGSTTTAIDVTASVDTLLATSSNSVGTILPEYKVRDLPELSRNVFNLVANTPGVQSSGGTIGIMAGGRLSDVNNTRDGINVNDGRYENGAWSVVYTSPDMVEEVKVVVAPVDAETSRGSGQVSMVTRSGGNQFKGSVFWVNHNSSLDAANWFDNFNGTAKTYDNRNQYGGRVGGPIVKNKTFFFALFEGQRDLKRQQAAGNTLTDLARQGIFRYFPGVDNGITTSGNPTVDRNGNPIQPANAGGALAAIDMFGNCTFNGAPVANCRTYRDPLRSAISTHPYMQETFRRMPSPNDYATAGDGLNTATIRFTRRVDGFDLTNGNGDEVNRDQYNARIDHNFNSKHKLSFIGTNEKTWGAASQAGQRIWPNGFDGETLKRPSLYTIQFTSTLSSNLLNQLRLGKKASNNWQWGSADRSDAVGAEARKYVATANGIPMQVNPQEWTSFFTIGGPSRWRVGINPMHSIADDLSYNHGKHAFKGGYEWRLEESNGFNDDPHYTPITGFGVGNNPVAGLDSTVFTGLSANNAANARILLTDLTASINNQVEDFGPVSAQDGKLVGYPTIQNNRHWNYQGEMSAYFKDDWKVRPDLTLNLGIHWEYYGQPYEHNGLAARVIGGEDAFLNVTCTSSPGTAFFTSTCSNLTQVQFVGKNSTHPDISTNLKGNDLNNWAPSVGFAWNVPWFGKGKTILRAGYGISYEGSLRNFVAVDQVINGVPGVNFGSTGLTYTPATYTNLSTLSLPLPLPTGTPTSAPFLVPTTARSLAIGTYNHVSPYTQNGVLEIQREIARNTTVEVRYVGTRGTKIWSTLNLNAIDAVHHNKDLYDAFNAVRAGGESPLLNQMLNGINLGGTGAQTVNGTTFTGAAAVRTNTTLRALIANGSVGNFINSLNTLTTGTGSTDNGAVLRRNGFPENYIVPDPQYSSVSMNDNLGGSTYHSLQMQFTKRLTNGFTNTTTWTWSKGMGDSGQFRDPSNRNIEKTLQTTDHAHQITSSGSYELPFGTGHFLMGKAPGWVQNAVGKWQLGGILNYNTGAPLSITTGGIGTISTIAANPSVVGPFPKGIGTVSKVSNGVVYFNGYSQTTDPYISNVSPLNGLSTGFTNKAIVNPSGQTVLVNPQPGQVGTLAYNTVRGPGSLGLDMNMIKRFRIHESQEFELRLDAINILNHPNFGAPNLNMNGVNTFGRITSATGSRSFVVNTRVSF